MYGFRPQLVKILILWTLVAGIAVILLIEFALQKQAFSANKPIRIFISVDTEGPTGIADWWAHDPQHPLYQERRQLLMSDINAAIEGCLAGGATEVLVSDDGKNGTNTIPETINPAAKLIYGRGFGAGMTPPLLDGIDESFAGIIMLGTHAKEGTPTGVLAHTLTGQSQKHRRYYYNGRESGEMTMYALVASHYKVPIIMVTGCEATCQEARELLGEGVVTVGVKKGLNPYRAVLISPSKTRVMIREGAREAVKLSGTMKPYRVEFPIVVRLQFPSKEFADEHEQSRKKKDSNWPGRRVDDRTFEAIIKSPLDPNLIL
jgi:D-amino peptidase